MLVASKAPRCTSICTWALEMKLMHIGALERSASNSLDWCCRPMTSGSSSTMNSLTAAGSVGSSSPRPSTKEQRSAQRALATGALSSAKSSTAVGATAAALVWAVGRAKVKRSTRKRSISPLCEYGKPTSAPTLRGMGLSRVRMRPFSATGLLPVAMIWASWQLQLTSKAQREMQLRSSLLGSQDSKRSGWCWRPTGAVRRPATSPRVGKRCSERRCAGMRSTSTPSADTSSSM
mmetsp:Transcript_79440/g.190752  ORF Transcript_79440/g.190752 Transcript_79440/m.190752 type:complete len:234 (+) Transcript_79440:233-934(+)